MCMSSSVMHISSPPTYSHTGGTGVHLCHIWSPFVTRTASKYLLYCILEKIKTGCGACFSDPANSPKRRASYWLFGKCNTRTGTHLHTTHQYDGVLHGFCIVFQAFALISLVANWFHRVPTGSTGCQPMPLVANPPTAADRETAGLASVGSRWNRLAAGTCRISWQSVESVGNGKKLYNKH